jgi:transcriptional antiterminator Rof (Rho-off)
MPQETKSMPAAEASAGSSGPTLPGLTADLTSEAVAFDILEKAFDYRGDVTLTLKDGRILSGYLFDRRRGRGINDSFIRILPAGSDDKVRIGYIDIKRIAFSDRDPAAGKSFETWVRKYVEKRLAGERASIESESLD